MNLRNLTIICSVIFMPTAYAEDEESIREVCRREIAGAYLTTFNQKARSEEYLTLLNTKLTRLNKELPKATKAHETAKNDADKNEYDVEKQRNVSAKKDHLQNVTTQISDITDLKKKTEIELEMAKKALKGLTQELKPIFSIKDLGEGESDFPYRLDFIHPCPKYRATCPLPNRVAYDLREISIANNACKAYADFSLGMNRK